MVNWVDVYYCIPIEKISLRTRKLDDPRLTHYLEQCVLLYFLYTRIPFFFVIISVLMLSSCHMIFFPKYFSFDARLYNR